MNKYSEEQLSRIDPVGEIKQRAIDLWEEAGQSSEQSWEDFFDQAQLDLTNGRGGQRVTRTADTYSYATQTVLTPEIEALRQSASSALIKALAHSFNHLLIEHECFCLQHVLDDHTVILSDGTRIHENTKEEIAETIAAIAEPFTSSIAVDEGKTLLDPKTAEFWLEYRKIEESKDEPLSFSDRNTISRIIQAMKDSEMISDVVFNKQQPELG